MSIKDSIFREIILEDFQAAKKKPLVVQELIDLCEFDISVSGFQRKFQRTFGITPGEFLNTERFKRIVKSICKEPKATGEKIAYLNDFKTHSDLSVFLKRKGTSLTEIRRILHEGDEI